MNKHFKKWLWETDEYGCHRFSLELINGFCQLKFSMRWGVYLDFFESAGLDRRAVESFYSIYRTQVDSNDQALKLAVTEGFKLLDK